MITEHIFVERMVGAINTCIRIINESDILDVKGKGIIENQWHSYIIQNENTFVAILTIRNKKKIIQFEHHEWFGFDINIHANEKINALLNELSNLDT